MPWDQLERAVCRNCRGPLLYVTSLPHPHSPQIRKTTFVCHSCNRTWTYALAAELAELYAAAWQFEAAGGRTPA